MDRRWMLNTMAVTALLAVCALGCDPSKSETGYSPHKVGMSNSELRTLYAPAFSPEAKATDSDKKDAASAHHPGVGG